MPEFTVGRPSDQPVPPTLTDQLVNVGGRVVRFRDRLQDAVDADVLAGIRRATGLDFTEEVRRARQDELLAPVVGELESVGIFSIIQSQTGAGAELPAGVGPDGRPRVAANANQIEYRVNERGELVRVEMLPMWNADP